MKKVLLNNSYVWSALEDKLSESYPNLTYITAKKDAVNGAVLMALNRLEV